MKMHGTFMVLLALYICFNYVDLQCVDFALVLASLGISLNCYVVRGNDGKVVNVPFYCLCTTFPFSLPLLYVYACSPQGGEGRCTT